MALPSDAIAVRSKPTRGDGDAAVTSSPAGARSPNGGRAAGELALRRHLLAEARRRVEAGVGRAGGGEQRGDGHQPVAGSAQHRLGGDRQGGAARVDDLVDRERAEDAEGDGHVDHGGDAERKVDRRGQLPRRVGQVLGGERDHAEAEEREERQRDAGHDVLERWVAGERQQVGSMLASVVTAKSVRMPITTTTTRVCAFGPPPGSRGC